jgi:hypothetical protein
MMAVAGRALAESAGRIRGNYYHDNVMLAASCIPDDFGEIDRRDDACATGGELS